jgi:O-antigen/teichoic acid export membrane protein
VSTTAPGTEHGGNPDHCADSSIGETAPVPQPSVAQSRKRWLAAAGMLGGGQIVVLAVGGVANIVLARTLGPAGFGTYSVLGLLVSLLALVAIFGLDTHLITELQPQDADVRQYGTGFRLSLEITIALCIPATVLAVATTHGSVRVASLVAVGELALTPFLLGRSVLLAHMRQGRVAAVGVANRLVLLAGVVFIAVIHASPELVWMMVVSGLAVAVEAILLGVLIGPPVGWLHRLGYRRKQLLTASWPLAAAAAAGVAYNRLDQLLLAAFRGGAEVGVYAVAVNLATTLSLISAVVYATTLPGVIEVCREGERSSSRRVVEDMALLMFIPGGLGIAVLAGAGNAISKLLFGNAYRGDHGLVAVLAFAELAVFAGTAVAAVLIAVNRRRALLVGTTVALAIDVVLCLLFLNSFGAMAAAWASLVSYGAAAIVAVWLAPDARSIATPLVRVTIKVALAAAIAAAVTAILPAVPGVAAGSLVYIAAAALLFQRDLSRAHQSILQRRASPKS